jgi:hypothetical protein
MLASLGGWGGLVNAGLQTAAQYYNTRQQADASERATDAQAKANAEALAFLKQQYQDRQQQLAPYIQAGQQSLQGLSRFMGLPGTPAAATPTRPTPTTVQPGGAPGNPALANLTGYDALGRPIGDANPSPQEPTGSTGGLPGLSNLNSLPGLGWTANIPGAPLGRPVAPQTTGGGSSSFVTIKDPKTGETQQRPANELQHWISVGGQQV